MNYSQIVDVFRSLCESADSPIKTFIATNNQFVLNDTNINYPCFAFDLSTLINTTDTQEEWTVAFWVLDKPLAGETDTIEVLTRTESIGKNAIYLIDEAYENLFLQPLTFSRLPIIEDFTDRLCGWRFETTLKNIEPPNICTTEWGDAAIIPVGGEGMGIDGGGCSEITATNPLTATGCTVGMIDGTNVNDVLTWDGTEWVSAPAQGGGGGLTCDDLVDCEVIQGLQLGVTGAQNTADSAVSAAAAAQIDATQALADAAAAQADATQALADAATVQAELDDDFIKKIQFGLAGIYFDPAYTTTANGSQAVSTTLLTGVPYTWAPGTNKVCDAILFQIATTALTGNIRLITYKLNASNQLGTVLDDSGLIPVPAAGNYTYVCNTPFSMTKGSLFATMIIADAALPMSFSNTASQIGSSMFSPTPGTVFTAQQRIQITTTIGGFVAGNDPAGQTSGSMTNQYIFWYRII